MRFMTPMGGAALLCRSGSGGGSSVGTTSVNLGIFPVAGANPGTAPLKIVIDPDEGVLPVITSLNSAPVSGSGSPATITLDSTSTTGTSATGSNTRTYTGTIAAVEDGAESFMVSNGQGLQLEEIDVNVTSITQGGAVTVGTPVPPSLPAPTP